MAKSVLKSNSNLLHPLSNYSSNKQIGGMETLKLPYIKMSKFDAQKAFVQTLNSSKNRFYRNRKSILSKVSLGSTNSNRKSDLVSKLRDNLYKKRQELKALVHKIIVLKTRSRRKHSDVDHNDLESKRKKQIQLYSNLADLLEHSPSNAKSAPSSMKVVPSLKNSLRINSKFLKLPKNILHLCQ